MCSLHTTAIYAHTINICGHTTAQVYVHIKISKILDKIPSLPQERATEHGIFSKTHNTSDI